MKETFTPWRLLDQIKTEEDLEAYVQARMEDAQVTSNSSDECQHVLDTRLHCDGQEHHYPCVRNGCNYREYFSKHTEHGERR